MTFDLLDRYLLEGEPPKPEVVRALLESPGDSPGAKPFYEGMRMLGPKTPDLTLIALRLVMAGKTASDANVVEMRTLVQQARAGGEQGAGAIERYREMLRA